MTPAEKTTMRKIQIALVAATLFLLAGACTDSGRARAQTANAASVTLRVDGMTCASCDMTVKLALKRLGGVLDAQVVRKPEGKVTVTYEPQKVTIVQMIEAVEKAGYNARQLPD